MINFPRYLLKLGSSQIIKSNGLRTDEEEDIIIFIKICATFVA